MISATEKTLREKLIEAGARAFHDPGVEPHDDDRHLAALTLDAFLDCLTENADEWAEETRVPLVVGGDALALLAVLRGTDD